ncbi:MAG: HEAT repeat domain-containing protein [Thermaerobacter sp.]|nr:HEAT repeat domain-containing protein [Thermaerobacter sp.]
MTSAPERLASEMVAEACVTRHHGRPGLPARSKVGWADRAADQVGAHDLVTCATHFLAHPHPTVRQVGLALLARPDVDAATAERLARELADDPDWEVREWVVEPLAAHTAREASGWLERWVQEGRGRRRAAVVAARQLVRHKDIDCVTALKVATAVVDDPDPYVAASVGTFLLADGIYPTCPDAFRAWVASLGPCPPDSPRLRHLAAVVRRHPASAPGGQRPGPLQR